MANQNLIEVMLDQELVQRLLRGLYMGASSKTLKVIICTDGHYHVESKELRVMIEVDRASSLIRHIHIHNAKLCAQITGDDLEKMRLHGLGKDMVKELQSKYSPVSHSLADNIVGFSRTYGNPFLD